MLLHVKEKILTNKILKKYLNEIYKYTKVTKIISSNKLKMAKIRYHFKQKPYGIPNYTYGKYAFLSSSREEKVMRS